MNLAEKGSGMPEKPIVVVGSINIDLVTHVERIPARGETLPGRNFETHPGGKGANQAAAVGRLGYPVAIIGRIGSDVFGEQLRQSLAGAGVDTSAVTVSKAPTGTAMILVQPGGDNSIIVTPGANALVAPADLDARLGLLRGAAMVLTQLEIPLATVEHLAAICAREGVPLMLDPAPARDLPSALWRNLTWITPNDTEARQLCQRSSPGGGCEPVPAVEALQALGARNVALKLGEQGAYLGMHDGLRQRVPAFAVNATDTTAAGDAFNGAFAVALARGESPPRAARFAAAAAAVSVTRRGAMPSLPTQADVESLMKEYLHEGQELAL
jgi:ribokinase